ncbi:MAG: hypothetical protein ACM3RX_03095 [Methanococcaceae archaeon]
MCIEIVNAAELKPEYIGKCAIFAICRHNEEYEYVPGTVRMQGEGKYFLELEDLLTIYYPNGQKEIPIEKEDILEVFSY